MRKILNSLTSVKDIYKKPLLTHFMSISYALHHQQSDQVFTGIKRVILGSRGAKLIGFVQSSLTLINGIDKKHR